jgi:ABC-type multidrug transport system fused ATPase/permease subunit
MFICTFIYMYAWVYTSEATSKRIRERYLKAVLRQDIAFFDDIGPGEITTRIQTDTRTWFFQFQPHVSETPHTSRFGPSGHIREGRRHRQLPFCIFYRFHLGIFEKLATGSGYEFPSALHLSYRWHHEQIHFQVYAVCLLPRRGIHESRIHPILGSRLNTLPKAEPSQRNPCLRSARLTLSALSMRLRPCMMLPFKKPTRWNVSLRSPKALAWACFSLPCMLPMASASSVSLSAHKLN